MNLLILARPRVFGKIHFVFMFPTALVFGGFLGKDQLNAVALAISMFQLIATPIAVAVKWVCSTRFARSYSRNKYGRLSVQLQRGLLYLAKW